MRKILYCPIVGGQCHRSELEIKVQKDTFFLAEPFQPEQEKKRREQAVKSALKDALGLDSSEKRLRIADREPTETAIFCDICHKIQSSTYGIVDLSGLNPNVLLELGMMFSLSKPVFVLIKESEKESLKEKLPSDIAWKRVIPYEEFVDIEKELSKQIQNRPQIEPEPSLAEQAKEAFSEVYPEFAQKIDSMLQEIKRDQKGRLDNLEGLLERAGLGESMPQEHEIKISPSLEKQIGDLYNKIEQMEKLIGLPENFRTAILRGNWHYHREEYEKALEFYEWALAFKPGSQEAWNNKGNALNNLGRYEEAITCYNKAIEIKEDYEEAWYNKGNALNNLGRYEEAITCYNKAIEIKEDFEAAWNNKGNALNNLGRYEEAITCYNKAIEIKEDYEAAWNNKGNALNNLGRHEEAITCYNKAIEIKEDYEAAWNNKGNALSNLGRYEEAITCYNKAIEIKEDFEEAWYNKGNALNNLGRHEEAITCYNKAIEIKPNYLSALKNLSEVLLILGDSTKGLETAKNAFNLAEEVRDKVISQFLCISAYLLRSENEKAQKEMKRLMNFSKKLEGPIVSGWDFSPLLPTIEERLEGKHKEILLSLISFLKGETEVGEFEKDWIKTFKESQ